uniref:Single-stranded DNA-binding protein, mitochondrial n=1 Tax=Caligus rogercresseyi TaxID=217165 RepID=C1BPI8_CALRO|nr:Single-stranded DNA-binding protein, mitochondrial precursor [Caligus rogercresseyi]
MLSTSIARPLLRGTAGRLQKSLVAPFSNSQNEDKKNYEKSLNEVTLLGRVGVHPQLRGSDERPCVTFSLATDQSFRKGVNEAFTTYTDWHNIVVFKEGLRQSVYEGVEKGQRALIKGRIRYSSVEDKSGLTRNLVSIVADQVIAFK